MYLPNSRHQSDNHPAFRVDGTIAAGGTAQLILPAAISRTMLMVMNTSSNNLLLEHGPARATAAVSGGKVTAVTVVNAGFNYTLAPSIQFTGGYGPYVANSSWDGRGLIGSPSPSGLANQGDVAGNVTYNRPAKAHAVLSGGAISSIVIDDPGFGYINPPEVIVKNNDLDPFGCAVPSSTVGIVLIATNGFYYINGTACWTDAVALYGGTTGQTYVCEYML